MKKVVKFGGSSLASAEQFRKVGDIIRSDEARRFVVPSAPGKRFDGDTKVTDMLYKCYAAAEAGEKFGKLLEDIKARYYEIIHGLELSLSLEEEFQVISESFAGKAGTDYAASRGEYLNGIVMAAYLGYEFVDAAEVICFDEDGNFAADETNAKLSARLAEAESVVVPGFYGAMPDGKVKKTIQGIVTLPHFISTTVMVGIILQIFNINTGLYGIIAQAITGHTPNNILGDPSAFRSLYVWSEELPIT